MIDTSQPTQGEPAAGGDTPTHSDPSPEQRQDEQPGQSQDDPSGQDQAPNTGLSEAEKIRYAMQKDITKLRNNIREKEAEIERLKAPKTMLQRPREEDFEDPVEYGIALGRFEAEEKFQKQQAEHAQKQRATTLQKEALKIETAFKSAEEKFRDGVPDYDTVTEQFNIVLEATDRSNLAAQVISDYVLRAPDGVAVGYHLGKNPAQLQKILELDHVSAMRELGRLSVSLESAPSPKRQTRPLSAPPNPLGGGGASPGNKPLWELNGEEYRKARFGK